MQVDVSHVLDAIHSASRDLKLFQTTNYEFLEAVSHLFETTLTALSLLSTVPMQQHPPHYPVDTDTLKLSRFGVARIVAALKELHDSIAGLLPEKIDSFMRDIFRVNDCTVEAAEFFHPVELFPGAGTHDVKFLRWSIYIIEGDQKKLMGRYYFERTSSPEHPYILSRTLSTGYTKLRSYGPLPPDYFELKNHVMEDLCTFTYS